MTPLEQRQRNRIGQLEHQVATIIAEAKLMRIDLHGQREIMATAIEHITNRDNKSAKSVLQNAIEYCNMQREPRKNSTP
jgi:hypothetical protein